LGKTYVAEILHDVEELLRLFILIASLLDSFLAHELLVNLGPHFVLLRFLGLKPPSTISGIDYGELARFFGFFTFAASDTVQLATTPRFTLKDDVFVVVSTVAGATGNACVSMATSLRRLEALPGTDLYTLIAYWRR